MEQIKQEYFPKDKNFTEIIIYFFGDNMNPMDLICYFKLKSLNKKLGLKYPDFSIQTNTSYGGCVLKYQCSCCFLEGEEEKKQKIKIICAELIKHGIKQKIIPQIEFIKRGEKNIYYKLEDYLKNKGLKLEDLNLEEIIYKEESMEEIR